MGRGVCGLEIYVIPDAQGSVSPEGASRHLLSGLLECDECRGGFFALTRQSTYGCGWHRDRGPAVCSNGLRVPRTALEARVLGAIRDQILVPDHAMYAFAVRFRSAAFESRGFSGWKYECLGAGLRGHSLRW